MKNKNQFSTHAPSTSVAAFCVCRRMSDNAESPTENQKDEPSIQHPVTEHTGSSDEKKKSMSYIYVQINCYKLIAKRCCSVYFGEGHQRATSAISQRLTALPANELSVCMKAANGWPRWHVLLYHDCVCKSCIFAMILKSGPVAILMK